MFDKAAKKRMNGRQGNHQNWLVGSLDDWVENENDDDLVVNDLY